MQIYMFTSEGSSNLRAFAGDPAGSKLPENHGPWTQIGSLRSDQHPPHQFSRAKVEQAIKFIFSTLAHESEVVRWQAVHPPTSV
jgi:hypothetical protein